MDKKQALGAAGAILLGLGTFAPIISLKGAGALSLFSQGDGMILLALAAGALLVAIMRRPATLLASAVGAGGFLGYEFYRFWTRLESTKADIAASVDAANLPIPALSWGWLVMAAGVVLLFAAYLLKAPAWRA